MANITDNERELIYKIEEFGPLDAIVVEGYDGVGKGRVLEVLSEYYGVVPYRPDYNLWNMFDHRRLDRWKISGFFWDVFSHFGAPSCIMLFDRGVISGAVYNEDKEIALHYHEMIRNCKVLHILVETTEEDYIMFNAVRNPDTPLDIVLNEYSRYLRYTESYKSMFHLAKVDYITYKNHYDKSLADEKAYTCSGCGHYNHEWCRHPVMNCKVDGNHPRCNLSRDKEVQDIDSEMYSMQS